ncbi:MAG TPA: UDP-4-amino-4,6-dideoxy-N-acetyl-beta-L-altrosamine N-acetyltransferase [Crocinitomix sp.]|nr:UDP-4-amino-4,6-dideoxy-N-acetyl-beta-L-altrosamine N-acetyltransferase [Crocinitomix sp.]
MSLNKTLLTNFIDLNDADKLMTLDWRNNKNIRKWMYNSNVISEKEHLAFMDTLRIDKTKQYYLVSYKGKYIGVIYFTNIDNLMRVTEFGLYSNPNLKGNGKMLMESICLYCFNILSLDKIIGEVFAENKRAITLYQFFNFEKIDENYHNDKKIIYMELKNENRKF